MLKTIRARPLLTAFCCRASLFLLLIIVNRVYSSSLILPSIARLYNLRASNGLFSLEYVMFITAYAISQNVINSGEMSDVT